MLETLPDSLILSILKCLGPLDVVRVGQCSRSLRRVCEDELLWRTLFHRQFRLKSFFPQTVAYVSWKSEFIRLIDEVPTIESEVLTKHTDQVLHVSFSNDGQRFATTSKDAFVHVWDSSHPVSLEYSYNMKSSWKSTEFSQFNESDTLLLVSGLLLGDRPLRGEIAIFRLTTDGLNLCYRVVTNPFNVFGSWYSDTSLFSADIHLLSVDHLVSKSVIWLNKVSQETESEHTAVMNQEVFRFYNPKASAVRSLLVANCVHYRGSTETPSAEEQPCSSKSLKRATTRDNLSRQIGNPPSSQLLTSGPLGRALDSTEQKTYVPNRDIDEFRSEDEEVNVSQEGDFSRLAGSSRETKNEEVIYPRDKWLIFTCGSEAHVPHQIGFKKIKPLKFKSRLDPDTSLQDRLMDDKPPKVLEQKGVEDEDPVDYSDFPSVANRFDVMDAVINLHGLIIGMTLSPDHRYLYVNCRPWPSGYTISHPLQPHRFLQETDIHVIDLVTLKQVAKMRRIHEGSNEVRCSIFLDASNYYLASGSEDKHGYLWDRYYLTCLGRFLHTDVVNCVAFNPKNSEMLVTVSDDQTIKVWRSKQQCRELGIHTTI